MSEVKHTEFAMKAVDLGELFKLFCGSDALASGGTTYHAELSVPEGPSTAGGKQALQHIKLVPAGGGATLVMGTVHPVDRTATLRTYEHVADTYRQRLKADFDIDEGDYDALAGKMHKFFQQQGLSISTEPYDPRTAPRVSEPRTKSSGSNPLPLIVTLVVVIVVVAAAIMLTRNDEPAATVPDEAGAPTEPEGAAPAPP